jgi:hypothetical protein
MACFDSRIFSCIFRARARNYIASGTLSSNGRDEFATNPRHEAVGDGGGGCDLEEDRLWPGPIRCIPLATSQGDTYFNKEGVRCGECHSLGPMWWIEW